MINLTTNYMGIELKNPIIAGASSMSADLSILKKLEVAGAAAIVYKTLFARRNDQPLPKAPVCWTGSTPG